MAKLTKYVSKLNGSYMTTDGIIDEKTGTLFITKEDGKVQVISSSTLKRWWQKVEEIETEEPTENTEPQEKPQETEAVKETKTEAVSKQSKKERTLKPNPEVIDNIINYIVNTATTNGATVFVPSKEIKMRSLKINGHMFAAFNFSSKSVILRCRSKAVKDVAPATKVVNHMFDYNYVINDLTEETKKLINDLIKVSMDYQIHKNTNSNNNKTKNKEAK